MNETLIHRYDPEQKNGPKNGNKVFLPAQKDFGAKISRKGSCISFLGQRWYNFDIYYLEAG